VRWNDGSVFEIIADPIIWRVLDLVRCVSRLRHEARRLLQIGNVLCCTEVLIAKGWRRCHLDETAIVDIATTLFRERRNNPVERIIRRRGKVDLKPAGGCANPRTRVPNICHISLLPFPPGLPLLGEQITLVPIDVVKPERHHLVILNCEPTTVAPVTSPRIHESKLAPTRGQQDNSVVRIGPSFIAGDKRRIENRFRQDAVAVPPKEFLKVDPRPMRKYDGRDVRTTRAQALEHCLDVCDFLAVQPVGRADVTQNAEGRRPVAAVALEQRVEDRLVRRNLAPNDPLQRKEYDQGDRICVAGSPDLLVRLRVVDDHRSLFAIHKTRHNRRKLPGVRQGILIARHIALFGRPSTRRKRNWITVVTLDGQGGAAPAHPPHD
jgi:hypothetical protein